MEGEKHINFHYDDRSSTSPMTYFVVPDTSVERTAWDHAQRRIFASDFTSTFELQMLIKFDMLDYLGY